MKCYYTRYKEMNEYGRVCVSSTSPVVRRLPLRPGPFHGWSFAEGIVVPWIILWICWSHHLRFAEACIWIGTTVVHQSSEVAGRAEGERAREQRGRGRDLTGVVTRSTTVPFISRNIISQSYWPIRTSCLREAPARFSFMCPTTLLCVL